MKLDARKGPIVASSVYLDGVLSADQAEITTPEIAWKTTEMDAMGSLDVPLYGQIEAMELAIKTTGNDPLMMKMTAPGKHTVVVNAVQQVVTAMSETSVEQVKITATGFGKLIPSRGYKNGEAAESEYKLSCSAYKESVNGVVLCDINKLAGKCQVMGKDYSLDIVSML